MSPKRACFALCALAASSTSLLSPPPARAQAADAADVEELRKEVRELRAQMQMMKSAINEAVEFDRLRANALSRALGSPAVDAPARPNPGDRSNAPGLREKPAPGSPAPKTPLGRRAATPTPAASSGPAEASGVIRGKVEVPSGEPVAYVFVENLRGPATRGDKVKIDQVNKQFVPSWAVVQRGTTVEFPNRDNIYHNVFSLSPGNAFDLGLYNSSGDVKGHTFVEPGSIDVYCNIHPQMAASVLVVPNRFYTKVKGDGTFELAGVPSGRRKIAAWAPGSRLAAEWVEVASGASADVTLRLERKASGHKNKQGRPYGSYE